MANGNRLLLGFIVDLVSLITVFIPSIVFEFGDVHPFQRGFFCDDNSIKYPYKNNTVPSWAVPLVGFLVTAITIIIAEYLHERYHCRQDKPPGFQLTATHTVPRFVFNCYKLIGTFLFGAAVNQSVTDICKYSVGRLRPHFLDVCRPNISANLCDGDPPGVYAYVDNFTCTTPDGYRLQDSRLSFLSGHTSLSAFCAVFFVLYVQARFTWSGSKLLRHFLQAIAIYLALYVGLSRISDYKHHWSDVLAGFVLGCFVASVTSVHVSYLFSRSSYLPVISDQQGSCSHDMMLNVEGADIAETATSPRSAGSQNNQV